MRPDLKTFDLLKGHPSRNYFIRPNSNYGESFMNGLKAGIWWIPHTLALIFRVLILPFVIGMLYALATIVACFVWHAVYLVAGLLGRLCEKGPDHP